MKNPTCVCGSECIPKIKLTPNHSDMYFECYSCGRSWEPTPGISAQDWLDACASNSKTDNVSLSKQQFISAWNKWGNLNANSLWRLLKAASKG